MIAWKAVTCYESDRTSGEAALDGCLFLQWLDSTDSPLPQSRMN